VTPAGLKERFRSAAAEHGHADLTERFEVTLGEKDFELGHGALAIAAITSCTTATDPAMMVAAGLLAQRARELGLEAKPWVKRILAPGSHATQLLLERAGLDRPLSELGFFTCGFGCMSCIGNSGEILPELKAHADAMELTSVLSGNRNFEGRISPDVSQNYLCQPAMVVAYSLVGTMDADLSVEPVGTSAEGEPVMLSDLMPSDVEVQTVLSSVLDTSLFDEAGAGLFDGSADWRAIEAGESNTFAWDEDSTYVRRAPYFDLAHEQDVVSIQDARALVLLGDFVTTDHISPAGSIAADSPAARYLGEHGVARADFNTYGARRGNHEVMARGTFANVKLMNALADGRRGGWTTNLLSGELTSIFDAAEAYAQAGVPLVAIAGKMYGSGSSRDWAGKGPALLGIRAVIAESFERIHRSNLIQMGIVPLELTGGDTAPSLGLDGTEAFDISDIDLTSADAEGGIAHVRATKADGVTVDFDCTVRVDTPMEREFLRASGILPYVLDQLA